MENRKFFKEIAKINNLGGIVRIDIENQKYSGLLINELFERNEKDVTLTIAGSFSEEAEKENLLKLMVPTSKFDNPDLVKIFQWRDLISNSENYQFIPVDSLGKLTLDPKKVKRIRKLSNFEFEELMKKYAEK